jgi:hypothetical protein
MKNRQVWTPALLLQFLEYHVAMEERLLMVAITELQLYLAVVLQEPIPMSFQLVLLV